jgi:hypothetical protein
MKFSEVVAQTLAWLQRDGRISYRALKREFDLNDEYLQDLKEEIIEAKCLASDENGKVLVWKGEGGNGESEEISSRLSVVSLQSLAPSTWRTELPFTAPSSIIP